MRNIHTQNFFPLPNVIFRLGLGSGEIAVYAYLISAELTKLTKRNSELNTLFKRLYEDNVLGKISNEQFRMLSQSYNEEQKDIAERLPVLEQEIEHLKDTANNVDRFITLAKRFICIEELTPEILRTFISKIVIHEKSQKHSRKATQQIDIYFTHIGLISA